MIILNELKEDTEVVSRSALYVGYLQSGDLQIVMSKQDRAGDISTKNLTLTRKEKDALRNWLNEH